MQDLLEFLINNISGSKDFSVKAEEEENGHVQYTVEADPSIMGIIIGKGGNTLRAIRNLLKIRATLEKKHVSLAVTEKAN